MAKRALQIGDRVRLTAKHLRNTGQYTGPAGQSVWTITGFSNGDRWAVTDERSASAELAGYYSTEELAADPTLRFRRIAVANLQLVGANGGAEDQ
jgi:hypothetical protein